MMSPRVAPPMIGLGLLEAVPEEQILANADPDDANQDGISGKPNQVWSRENNKVMLGRFGWKAGVPSINQQAAEAANGDIGLSTTMIRAPSGDCTESEKDCLDAPNGNSPQYQDVELGDDLFKLVAFYSHNLAVPPRRDPADPKVLKGKELFYSIGCASCHKPKFVTGEAPGEPHLSHQLIWPYTDLLLHDMGEGLADIAPTARRRAANGARRRSGASALPRPSTAIRCFCMTGARAVPHRGHSLARRRGPGLARQIRQALQRGPGAPDRFRELAVTSFAGNPPLPCGERVGVRGVCQKSSPPAPPHPRRSKALRRDLSPPGRGVWPVAAVAWMLLLSGTMAAQAEADHAGDRQGVARAIHQAQATRISPRARRL